jgi:hypothetical protein
MRGCKLKFTGPEGQVAPIGKPPDNTRRCVMWKRITVAIGILMFVGSPANAAYRLILCDTAEQIEQVFTLHADEITFDEAIDAANKRAGRTNACSKVTVEATLLEEVRDITLRGNTYTIVKVAVTKVSDGELMLAVPFLEQFAVMPGKNGQGV